MSPRSCPKNLECIHNTFSLHICTNNDPVLQNMSIENVPSFASDDYDRDAGVLNDVLEELDRERWQRAELAATVRKLQDERSGATVERASLTAMEAQVQGYQQLVDALTLGKPAIAAAEEEERKAPRQRKTLPLHVVRLLEVLPWDPKAQQFIFAVEEVFEWQICHEGAWQGQLRHFPSRFKSLPTVDNSSDGRNLLQFLAGDHTGKDRLFTDARLTARYDLEAGYPPPTDGGVWEWVGSWRVGTRTAVTGSRTEAQSPPVAKVDCDAHGWSYVMEPRDFVIGLPDMIWDHAGTRPYRRRRWTRQRVLVDYLNASECTKQFLKLLAENARLSLSASKINEQLIATKMALTETEEKLVHANDMLQQRLKGDANPNINNAVDPRIAASDSVVTGPMKSMSITGMDSPPIEPAKSFQNDPTVRLDAVVEPPSSPSREEFKFDWTKIGLVNKLAPKSAPAAASGPAPTATKTPNIFRMISPDFPSDNKIVN